MMIVARRAASMWRVSPLAASLATAVGLGLALLVSVSWDNMDMAWDDWWDTISPVATGSISITERELSAVKVSMTIRRNRDGCDFKRIQAYGRIDTGELRDAYVGRLDRPQEVRAHPAGESVQIGTWEIWPTHGARSVVVYARYQCHDRKASAKIGEAPL